MNETIKKQCTKCREVKELGEFYNDKRKKDGKESRCKECVKSYYEKNRDHILTYKKVYRLKNIDRFIKKDKKYYELNRDDINAKRREYRENNKEEMSKVDRDSYQKNKDSKIQSSSNYSKTPIGKAVRKNMEHKRRSKEKTGDVTTIQLLELKQSATHCYWCGIKLTKKTQKHIDHYVPLSKGGKHTLSNLVMACSHCNITKHAKDPYEFAITIGRLL